MPFSFPWSNYFVEWLWNRLMHYNMSICRVAGEGVLSKAKITVFSALIYLGLHQCHLSNIFNGMEYEYAYTEYTQERTVLITMSDD